MKKLFADDIFGEQINDYELPLTEEYYNAFNFEDYLNNDKFHHSHKGCQIEMILNKIEKGNLSINKICHTHNKTCSKTGWELGWYMGTPSKCCVGVGRFSIKCSRCGCEIMANSSNRKYCDKCKTEVSIETYKKRLEYDKRAYQTYKESKSFNNANS